MRRTHPEGSADSDVNLYSFSIWGIRHCSSVLPSIFDRTSAASSSPSDAAFLSISMPSPSSTEGEFVMLGSEDAVSPAAPQPVGDTISLFSDDDVPVQQASAVPAPMQQPATRTVPTIKRAVAVPQKFEVERLSENVLYSPSFTDYNYFVHVSSSYTMLVIKPDDKGTVYCINNRIELEGLGSISGFTQRKFLPAEYSDEYGGMLVRLV